MFFLVFSENFRPRRRDKNVSLAIQVKKQKTQERAFAL